MAGEATDVVLRDAAYRRRLRAEAAIARALFAKARTKRALERTEGELSKVRSVGPMPTKGAKS